MRPSCCASCRWRRSCPIKSVRPRLPALLVATAAGAMNADQLRLQLLDGYCPQIRRSIREEKQVVPQLEELVSRSGSTLGELCGLTTRSVAELLVEVGDVRRFTEGGFARFNGTGRWQPRPRRGPASRSGTATTPAAIGASTRSCTGWRSPSSVASPAPSASTPRAHRRAHQEGGPPHPQAPPLRVIYRRMSATSPPPTRRPPPPAPPRHITARDPAQSRGGRQAERSEPPAASLTAPRRARGFGLEGDRQTHIHASTETSRGGPRMPAHRFTTRHQQPAGCLSAPSCRWALPAAPRALDIGAFRFQRSAAEIPQTPPWLLHAVGVVRRGPQTAPFTAEQACDDVSVGRPRLSDRSTQLRLGLEIG